MDALTDVLRGMRLCGGVFLEAAFTAPWCIRARVGPEDCRPFMPLPRQLIAYHYIVDGTLLIHIDAQPAIRASGGQLLILPRNDSHILASAPGLPPAEIDTLIAPPDGDGLAHLQFGGHGERTRVLCGFLGSPTRDDSLLASLPSIIRLDLATDGTAGWVEGSIRYAARGMAEHPVDASARLAQLAELLLAEAIRAYVRTLPTDQVGWLAALRDPYVARVLTLIHRQPGYPWTLDDLTRRAGLSRSALSERFMHHFQLSPMRYIAEVRLQRAAGQLRDDRTPIGRIAVEAGYESEASFARAFKRRFKNPPGVYRRIAKPHNSQRSENRTDLDTKETT